MGDQAAQRVALELRPVRWRGSSWLAFSNANDAAWHVIVHVLSEPEACVWKSLLPDLESKLDLGDADERLRWLDRAHRDGWGALQTVYDAYVASAQQAVSDADRRGWYGQAIPSLTFFGLDGIVVGVRHCVRTVHVAGVGSPQATTRRQEMREESLSQCEDLPSRQDLRRLVGSRASTPAGKWPNPWEPEHCRHEESWTAEQRVYYRVFRKAYRAVQKRAARGADGESEPARARSLWELRRKLPKALPSFEEWGSWREERNESRSASHDVPK
jgi:hypothetical protein